MAKNTNSGKRFLSNLKLYSDYFKWKDNLGRYENWDEACEDIVDGHRIKYTEAFIEPELESILESLKSQTILASQRNLQFRYPQLKQHNSRIFNCTVVHVCRPEVFQEVFYLGLCGCGVGASLLLPFVNCLPKIQLRSLGTKTFIVEDSIEGWADALGVLMSSYMQNNQPFPEYAGYEIKFDYSQIRENGAYISGGFKAPGPTGLKNSLEKIEKILEQWIRNEGDTIRPILAYDIICHASDAVLSGGVRRSALSMIVDPHDEEMIYAKTGSWRQDNPQRARSNNSVLIPRSGSKPDSREFFDRIVNLNQGDNDIGFVFCNTWFDVFNPCFTLDTKVLTSNGWLTFEQLLNKQELGEDVFIVQDNRASGYLEGNEERWNIDMSQSGTVLNKAGKIEKTGTNVDIYELELSCGRKVKATGNHKFATTEGMKELLNLKKGDKVLITANEPKPINFDGDFNDGFLSGLCVGDGFIINDEAGINVWENEENEQNNEDIRKEIEKIFYDRMNLAISSNSISSDGHKRLSPDIKFKLQTQVGNKIKHTLSSTGFKKYLNYLDVNKNDLSWLFSKAHNFKAGFIAGLFFTDGHVDYNNKSKSISLRITQSNKTFLNDLALILQEIGIIASVYDLLPEGNRQLPNSKRELQDYYCKASYRLSVAGCEQVNYMINNILYLSNDKVDYAVEILQKLKSSRSIYRYKKVVNITYVGKEDVYCLEENNNRTLIANGITAARCFEIGFTPVDTYEDITKIDYDQLQNWTIENQDLFGIQMCNLNEINAEKCQTEEQFLRACKDAAILGTLQAGYTDFPYLGKRTESLVRREALLGISITGWMNNPKLFNPELLRKGAQVVIDANKDVAKKIGINQAARTTCVKPSGNACTKFDTIIKTNKGDLTLLEIFKFCLNKPDFDIESIIHLRDVAFKVEKVLQVYDKDNNLQDIEYLYINGSEETYDIEFEDGEIYSFTANHKLMTSQGWKLVKDLTENDEIISF